MRARTVALPLAALCACAPAPRYEPPPGPAPSAWRDTSVLRATTSAESPWWLIYRDSTLGRLVRTALARNTNLGVSLERVSEARALLAEARGAQLPTLGVSGSVYHSHVRVSEGGAIENATSDLVEADASASWEADIFGYQRNAARSAAASLQAAEERRRGVALLIVASVASAYVDLQADDQQLQILQRALEARQAYLETTRRRFDSAASAELDWRQAQSLYESAHEQIIDLQEASQETENALSVLAGQAPGTIRRSGAPGDQLLAAVPAGLPSDLVVRRPDVLAAERELAAAGADVAAAKAELFPRLTLSADLEYTRQPGTSTSVQGISMNTPAATTLTWVAAATLSQPLFMGGQLLAQVRAADSRRRQALVAYQGTVLGALQEAEDQLAALKFAGDRRTSADSQVVYGQATLRSAEQRYRAGTSPFLEVVDAQRTLLTADLGAVAARVRQADAVIGLYKALGGGWQTDSAAAREPAPR